jgi:hypothetical protein
MRAWSLALLMVSSAAFGQTAIILPLPTAQEDGAPCCYVPTQTVATGIDATRVTGLSEWNVNAPLGRNHHGCAKIVWDLSGKLVSVTPYACTPLPALWPFQYETFTNSSSYTASTTIALGGANGGSPSGWYYQPVLTLP